LGGWVVGWGVKQEAVGVWFYYGTKTRSSLSRRMASPIRPPQCHRWPKNTSKANPGGRCVLSRRKKRRGARPIVGRMASPRLGYNGSMNSSIRQFQHQGC